MARTRLYPKAEIISISKHCSKCGEVRLLSEFRKDRKASDGLFSTCSPCLNASHREAYAKNPKVREKKQAKDKERKILELKTRPYFNCPSCKVRRAREEFNSDKSRTSEISRLCSICVAKAHTTKKCSGCKEIKNIDSFFVSKSHVSGLTSLCKPCARIKTKKWRNGNEKAKLSVRKWHLKKKYKISWETFEALYSSQGGRCAVCKKEIDIRSKNTCVDHCHITGIVRGILCVKCNSGIGHLGDNLEGVEAAANYLRERQIK